VRLEGGQVGEKAGRLRASRRLILAIGARLQMLGSQTRKDRQLRAFQLTTGGNIVMVRFLLTVSERVLRAGSVLLIGSVVNCSPGMAQSTKESAIAQLRMALAERALWGRDYAVLIASIPGWARLQERTIIITPDVVFGGTPFRSREEAETQARSLAAYIEQAQTPARDFVNAAVEGRKAISGKIGSGPYSRGASYRVVLDLGSNFLPNLTIAEVQRTLGKEEAIRSEAEDFGEGRPLVYTNYVYADGALIFQLSNYAPAPDQVFRVVLDISSSLEAIGGTR
jgi:hypothetical protein